MKIKMWQTTGILTGLLMTAGPWVAYSDTATMAPGPQTKIVVFPLDIKFDINRATIKPGKDNDAEFKKLTKELSNYTYAKVEIEGYTDSTGPADFNQKLAEDRAQAVRQRFIDSYGINPERIKAVAFGETKPVASNETVDGRKQNRRVIARIIRLEPEKIQSNGIHL